MEPSNNRAPIDADLSICHMCGEPAARWAQVLVRTVGVCRDHAAGPAAAINAIERDAAVAAEKVESAHRLIDHQIAWAIGQIAANEGAELTVAAIADAIAEDRAAGCDRPSITNLEVFFGESDPAIDAAHPALCRLLDGALS